MNCRRGDIVIADFSHANIGTKLRPVLIVQSDAYNSILENTLVAQITSVTKHAADPAHVFIDISTFEGRRSGLLRNSVVSCNNLNTIHFSRIHRVIGGLSKHLMQQVDNSLLIAFGIQQ